MHPKGGGPEFFRGKFLTSRKKFPPKKYRASPLRETVRKVIHNVMTEKPLINNKNLKIKQIKHRYSKVLAQSFKNACKLLEPHSNDMYAIAYSNCTVILHRKPNVI